MDDKGRECSAVKVFSMSIKYFKKRLLNDLGHSRTPCAEEHIRWVLTVPAIWGEQAKQFMQESSYQVHKNVTLRIILIPCTSARKKYTDSYIVYVMLCVYYILFVIH